MHTSISSNRILKRCVFKKPDLTELVTVRCCIENTQVKLASVMHVWVAKSAGASSTAWCGSLVCAEVPVVKPTATAFPHEHTRQHLIFKKELLYYTSSTLFIVLCKIVLTCEGLIDHQWPTGHTLRIAALDYRTSAFLRTSVFCLCTLRSSTTAVPLQVLRKRVSDECICTADPLDLYPQNPPGSTKRLRHCPWSLGFLVWKIAATKTQLHYKRENVTTEVWSLEKGTIKSNWGSRKTEKRLTG